MHLTLTSAELKASSLKLHEHSAYVLQAELGKRVMDPAANKATVAVVTGKTYDYEMRSITKAGAFSKAFAVRTCSDPEAT